MSKRGFTIVEMLVVLGLIVLLATFVTQPFKSFRDSQVLLGSVEDVLSTLSKARSETLAGLNDSAYGAHFQSDRLVLFAGSSYQAGAAGNETILLNQLTTISAINLTGGGSDLVFQRLSGEAASSGTVTIGLVNSPSQTKTVTILTSGIAGAN